VVGVGRSRGNSGRCGSRRGGLYLGGVRLPGSVPGVAHVRNRLIVVPTETSDSLINKGVTFLDAGDYSSAIDCFRKASADPNNRQRRICWTRRCERSRPKKNYLRTGSNVLPVGASAETSVSQFLAV